MLEVVILVLFLVVHIVLVKLTFKYYQIEIDFHVPYTLSAILFSIGFLSFWTNLPLLPIAYLLMMYLLRYIQELSWKQTFIITFIPFIIIMIPFLFM